MSTRSISFPTRHGLVGWLNGMSNLASDGLRSGAYRSVAQVYDEVPDHRSPFRCPTTSSATMISMAAGAKNATLSVPPSVCL